MSPPIAAHSSLVRNNVRISGRLDGRPLVFAHGFGCSQEAWRLVAPQFERDYRVILFDHVGAGGSDATAYDRARYDSLHGYADDILEIITELDLHDVVFVGHSVASIMGVLAANDDPSRFGALVLVGPSPRYVDDADADYVGGFTPDDINDLLDSLDSNYLGWSERMAPVMMGNPDRPELGEELTTLFCRVDPAVARQFARVTFLSDNRRDLAAVSVPTLVLQSRRDVIAPQPVGEFVADQIPGAQLVVLDSTGHIPNLSGADQVARATRDFIQ